MEIQKINSLEELDKSGVGTLVPVVGKISNVPKAMIYGGEKSSEYSFLDFNLISPEKYKIIETGTLGESLLFVEGIIKSDYFVEESYLPGSKGHIERLAIIQGEIN